MTKDRTAYENNDYLRSMRRYLLTTLAAVFSFSLAATAQKKIFEDDFKDNRNGWRLRHDSNFLVEIKNGALHIEKYQKNFVSRGCLWYNKSIPDFNTLKDFSVTLYAKFKSGSDIFDMIDFQWGTTPQPVDRSKQRLPSNSLYQLNFIVTGEVRLDYFDNNWSYFVRKNIKQALGAQFDPHNINKYEIAQKDSLVIFKINDKEVLRHFCNPIAGNSIGFQECLKTAWELDKIVIYENIDKPVKTSVADTVRQQISPTFKYPSGKDLKVYPNPFDHDLYVNFYMEREDNVQLSLIDMNGVTLQQHHRKLTAGVQNLRLYADVPPGTYVLKVQVGNKAMTTTLLKE
jgi:hypothetical protein